MVTDTFMSVENALIPQPSVNAFKRNVLVDLMRITLFFVSTLYDSTIFLVNLD